LYNKRDPRPIIDALAILKSQGLSAAFEQVGSCKADFRLHEYALERGVEGQVAVHPPVPHDAALARMAAADALVLVQPGTDIQVPGKLFEMLLFRKPILALADPGAAADIIERYQLGAVVDTNRPQAIAAALASFMRDDHQAGTTGRWDLACADFDGRTLTGQLAQTLNAMCDSGRSRGRGRTAARAAAGVQ
jgi:glycosyltransferase involved in cell wall biosynthesis